MVMAVCESLPAVKKIYLCDMNLAKAKALAADYKDVYSVEIVPTSDAKTAALDSQVVITETTASSPFIDKSWIKKGMTVINMGSYEADLDVVSSSDVIAVDYWDQIITYESKGGRQALQGGQADPGECRGAFRHGAGEMDRPEGN